MSTATPHTEVIESYLRQLHGDPGLYELRVLDIPGKGKPHVASGYFHSPPLGAAAALQWDKTGATGIYTTLNELHVGTFARSPDEIVAYPKVTTGDTDVVRRRWLPLDFDPIRPAGIASTEAELQAAVDAADAVDAWLHEKCGVDAIRCMSGNGAYLLLRVDLPNDAEASTLVKGVLDGIAAKLEELRPGVPVKLDLSVHNAARILRVMGTTNRKGANIEDRPHRVASWNVGTQSRAPIPIAILQQLAELAKPKPKPGSGDTYRGPDYGRLDVARWLQDAGIGCKDGGTEAKGRKRFILDKCPFNEAHKGRDACIMQDPNGKLSFKCFHDSCTAHGWKQVRDCIGGPRPEHYERNGFHHEGVHEPPPPDDQTPPHYEPEGAGQKDEPLLPIMTAGEMFKTYTKLREPLIDGLLRVGETMNFIAASKVGKSWLTLDLAFAVALGRPWLGFATQPGNVLIVDNELHPETITGRLRRMAEARGIAHEDIAHAISILHLRGRLQDLHRLGHGLRKIEPGRFALIIIDAFYRTLPMDSDENSNANMSMLYNVIDGIADTIRSSFANVHHASKGDQSTKAVTDVGAGAGAQARATDTHLILRPHEEDNVFVLDAAVRSWPPVAPMCLRWGFPIWTPAPELDPTALRPARSRRRPVADKEPAKVQERWTAKRFAEAFGKREPQPRSAVLESAESTGLSEREANRLLRSALEQELLFQTREKGISGAKLIITNTRPSQTHSLTRAPPHTPPVCA